MMSWRAPIVVDREMVIICGHTRLLAAKKLGLDVVPVHVADNLTPEQVQAYRIADNRTGEIAEWDYSLLPLELQELQDANFDLSLLGFDTDELDKLLNGETEEITDIWEVMCYTERYKLLHNLISKILVFEDRLEIEPNVDGIKSLLKEAGIKVKK